MKHLTMFVLAFALLLLNTAFGPAVHSAAQAQSSPKRISPETLEKRYKTIWDSVEGPGVEVPQMIVHLGASAGNRIAVWVKSEHERKAVARDWVLNCGATDAVSVKEDVHDPDFGVSSLAITRNDGNAASLLCTLSMGGSSAQLVVPILRQLSDQEPFSFLAYSCNEPFSTKDDRKGILARDLSLWLRMDARASGENSHKQLPFRPQFVLGVGDQIYVDPDPDGKQPLSFFKGKRSNEFLIQSDRDSLFKALDVVYRYNFSLPPLADALSKLPSYMM